MHTDAAADDDVKAILDRAVLMNVEPGSTVTSSAVAATEASIRPGTAENRSTS